MASRFFESGICIAWLALGATMAGQQSDRARTEALATRAAVRLQALQREADRLASEERSLLGDLRRFEVERQIKDEELQRADASVKTLEADLLLASARIEALQRKNLAETPDLRARIVEIYKLGQGRYLRLLLSTAELRRIGEAARTIAVLSRLDRDRIASHQRTVEQLVATRTALERQRRELETVRVAAARAKEGAARAALARSDLIRDIDRRRDLNAQLAGELQAAQQKLQQALRDIGGGKSPVDSTVLPFKPFRGDLDWPVVGALRHPFTAGPAPNPGASNGIEIAAREAAPVQAVHEGVVAFAAAFTGFGNLVILDHGGQTFSLYGNLQEIVVAKAARVDKGQRLGTVGTTPAGPPGLYFELRVDGRAVDPLQWLRKR